MVHFEDCSIRTLFVHRIGNASQDEGFITTDQPVTLDDELHGILRNYFCSALTGDEVYHFYNDIGLEQNEVYHEVKKIFEDPDTMVYQSANIAAHLYRHSTHPRIKAGELYIVWFDGVVIEDEVTEAIGIFKSESKETFLNIDLRDKSATIQHREGIPALRPDKACMIFNTEPEQGYKVCIYDHLNRSNEAGFWKDDFLCVQPSGNDYYMTNQVMNIARQFVTGAFAEEFEATKADQADFLHRSVEYFKHHDTYDNQNFADVVFGDTEIKDSFFRFQEDYSSPDISEDTTFSISLPAVKKQSRFFKSVIKLDKNFHIYIHGNNEMIEQGVDEHGRKFYKIYYEQES
ncbi:MAG: nucleoid-associated protein [Saprospiraceae bacterium]|nr:nucleoid-associated protein [Saprospiraceae bacterium]